jgi:DNA gyrase subunit B
VLEIDNGPQIAGEDLKRLAREAMGIESLIKRLHQRAPDSVLEQAALAGVFAQGAGDKEAESAAVRLNAIAEEGEATWSARFDPDHALVLERTVRGVAERVLIRCCSPHRTRAAWPNARPLWQRPTASARCSAAAAM